jgi:DNA-binding MarR family transcriptional regulator
MSFQDMAGHLIRRLHQHSTLVFAQRTQAAGFDLTPVQYAALEAIHEHPGSDQAHVAEFIGYDRATIGGVIDRLEKKGWVKRVVSQTDRRARQVSLTAKGKVIRSRLQPIVRDFQQEILQPLNARDQEALMNWMRKIVWKSDPDQGADAP